MVLKEHTTTGVQPSNQPHLAQCSESVRAFLQAKPSSCEFQSALEPLPSPSESFNVWSLLISGPSEEVWEPRKKLRTVFTLSEPEPTIKPKQKPLAQNLFREHGAVSTWSDTTVSQWMKTLTYPVMASTRLYGENLASLAELIECARSGASALRTAVLVTTLRKHVTEEHLHAFIHDIEKLFQQSAQYQRILSHQRRCMRIVNSTLSFRRNIHYLPSIAENVNLH